MMTTRCWVDWVLRQLPSSLRPDHHGHKNNESLRDNRGPSTRKCFERRLADELVLFTRSSNLLSCFLWLIASPSSWLWTNKLADLFKGDLIVGPGRYDLRAKLGVLP